MMTRRDFLAGAAAAGQARKGGPARPPNIVWIMGDDLGYGDLGCYGQDKIRTPHIDRLAEEGTRFTDAYAGCTVCAPSRSVLMTGYHMGHTSVRSNPGGVPLLAEDVTVAEVLQQAGYATGCFGKWGLGDIGTPGVPTRQGFDEFFGYLHQVHAHFYYPRYLIHNESEYPLEGNENGKRATYSHDAIAGKALDFIRRNRARPFFCYVPFTIPHWELLVPEDSLAEYRGRIPERGPYIDPRGHYANQEFPRAAYAAMITRMDRDVGRILALLQQLNLERTTLVFFTSDNGSAERLRKDEFFRGTAGFRGHKQNLYEGGIRVPMIARWPGRVAAGAVSDCMWGFQDFLPTAAEAAGIKPPKSIDGVSVLPALLGGEQQPHEYLYWELPGYDANRQAFRDEIPMQAVRMGNWKAVRPKPNGPVELYDLERDPGETTDVAPEHPRVMQRIEEILKSARTPPRPQKEIRRQSAPGRTGML
ncbi:MAG: arylsulfatase [Bryobacterales bacterium]|nr:arylsulfatase [Bryobacterales bacterium]